MQNKPTSTYITWAAKQQGNPIMLLVAGAALTGSFYVCYKQLYAPWASKNRMTRAEQFADLLYEVEMNKGNCDFENVNPPSRKSLVV